MDSYSTKISKVSELDNSTCNSLVELYLNYYDESNEQKILHDLAEKQEILLLHHNDLIVGFTTMEYYNYQWSGETVNIVFSGDTVIDRAHWGQQALAFRWIEHMGKMKAKQPDIPFYWLLIVKGHRTFRYLPTFSKSFHPHWAIDRSDLKSLKDSLAIQKFGNTYNPHSGVVEYTISRGQLKDEIAFPSDEEMKKDAVKFFIKKNPNYLNGHELVCLCELELENFKPLTKRVFRRAFDDRIMATAD